VIEMVTPTSVVPSPPPGRHPLDPDPVRSTKATTVLVLGIVAVITGPLVGGAVPAVLAFVLAGQAQADIADGRGYLTGLKRLRIGRILAWIGLVLAVAALVAASVVGIVGLAAPSTQDFPDTSN
jgi:hypothetical protein